LKKIQHIIIYIPAYQPSQIIVEEALKEATAKLIMAIALLFWDGKYNLFQILFSEGLNKTNLLRGRQTRTSRTISIISDTFRCKSLNN